MRTLYGILFLIACAGFSNTHADAHAETRGGYRFVLKDNWKIQPSTQVQKDGKEISTTGFRTDNWYPATVPSTVLAALVEEQVLLDPYYGLNLRSLPGASNPIGREDFMLKPMPPESPFRSSWWYRTEFGIPSAFQNKTVWLNFSGVNYRSNVWLNGHLIASAAEMAGTWRTFEFDINGSVVPGTNTLAVEVFPPGPDDLAITFVDWAPTPPDKCMGIWRDVYLTATGPISLRYPQVITRLDLPAADKAHLTVSAELRNASEKPVRGVVKGDIGGIHLTQSVELGPREVKNVSFTSDDFANLNVSTPKLWWPAQVGPQNLYTLDMQVDTGGGISDQQSIRFGIREIKAQVDARDHLVFSVNGKKILIRGAGYSFDMLLRSSRERQEAELKYVRDLNLNTIRMEGKIEDDHFLDLTDEYGILVLAGWCCCDQWEQWSKWKEENYTIAAESLRDQIRRLRSHPSLLSWMNGSDFPPPPKVEEMYIKILHDNGWPNPFQSSATATPTSVTGRTGVKMTGPYLYVAPPYWLLDKEHGGAHGFNTETIPGPAIPPFESLRRMLPREHLWPIDTYWDYHAEGREFRSMELYEEIVNARYGPSASAEEYAAKAQVAGYEAYRAMFEAFGRNKYTSTGVIGWMLNSAWPSLHYHIYDYYLRQGGAYFGTKKANELLHIQYSYDDQSIVIVNSYYQPFKGLKANAGIYNLDMSERYARAVVVDVGPDSSTRVFSLPQIQDLTPTYFLRLRLEDPNGTLISSNFYWLSVKPDVLDWNNTVRLRTPSKQHADFTGLMGLPKVNLRLSSRSEAKGDIGVMHVTVENPTQSVAFFVHLKLNDGLPEYDEEQNFHDQEILPVLWEDNYFPLVPGEKRNLTVTYRAKAGAVPVVEVQGWNLAGTSR
ncbi:MAG TPA: beta galactosidase jelly roll domain-containing protein [Acidobacteriota bacterium]|nr:beta galactosidase jelly roll domain-containing protein [Acidobacteriota bacterium]